MSRPMGNWDRNSSPFNVSSVSCTALSSGERGSETAAKLVSFARGTSSSREVTTEARSAEDWFSHTSTSNASGVASGRRTSSLSLYFLARLSGSGAHSRVEFLRDAETVALLPFDELDGRGVRGSVCNRELHWSSGCGAGSMLVATGWDRAIFISAQFHASEA